MRVVAAATAAEIRMARRDVLRVWILFLQYAEQVFARLRDVACAEGEHEVAPSGDALQHRWYGVLLGYVVDVGVAARLADRVHYELPVDAGLGHLACAVDLGDEHGVGRGERAAELPVEGAGTGVTVRLEDSDDPAAVRHGGAGGRERRRELSGVVGVVVDDANLGLLSLELEAAAYAPEVLQGAGSLVGVVAEPARDPRRGQGVEHVVAAVDAKLDLAASVAVLEQHIAVRRQRSLPGGPRSRCRTSSRGRGLGGHQGQEGSSAQVTRCPSSGRERTNCSKVSRTSSREE